MSFNPFEYVEVMQAWNAFIGFLPRFIAGILVFATFYLLYHGTVLILRHVLERRKAHASIISLTVKTYKIALITTGVVLALQQMGVHITAALTGLGVLGVALGFAAQDSVSNYIAGITIFWDKPFYVGDYIEVGERYGRVTEITMRSTRIRTRQNQYLIVPNRTIVNELVINHSKNGEVRVDIPVSIAYENDVMRARDVLLAIVDPDSDPRLSQYLRANVVVNRLADSGVDLYFRLWINNAEDEMPVRFEYLEKAKYALEGAGLNIPFPQRVIHMRHENGKESN